MVYGLLETKTKNHRSINKSKTFFFTQRLNKLNNFFFCEFILLYTFYVVRNCVEIDIKSISTPPNDVNVIFFIKSLHNSQ